MINNKEVGLESQLGAAGMAMAAAQRRSRSVTPAPSQDARRYQDDDGHAAQAMGFDQAPTRGGPEKPRVTRRAHSAKKPVPMGIMLAVMFMSIVLLAWLYSMGTSLQTRLAVEFCRERLAPCGIPFGATSTVYLEFAKKVRSGLHPDKVAKYGPPAGIVNRNVCTFDYAVGLVEQISKGVPVEYSFCAHAMCKTGLTASAFATLTSSILAVVMGAIINWVPYRKAATANADDPSPNTQRESSTTRQPNNTLRPYASPASSCAASIATTSYAGQGGHYGRSSRGFRTAAPGVIANFLVLFAIVATCATRVAASTNPSALPGNVRGTGPAACHAVPDSTGGGVGATFFPKPDDSTSVVDTLWNIATLVHATILSVYVNYGGEELLRLAPSAGSRVGTHLAGVVALGLLFARGPTRLLLQRNSVATLTLIVCILIVVKYQLTGDYSYPEWQASVVDFTMAVCAHVIKVSYDFMFPMGMPSSYTNEKVTLFYIATVAYIALALYLLAHAPNAWSKTFVILLALSAASAGLYHIRESALEIRVVEVQTQTVQRIAKELQAVNNANGMSEYTQLRFSNAGPPSCGAGFIAGGGCTGAVCTKAPAVCDCVYAWHTEVYLYFAVDGRCHSFIVKIDQGTVHAVIDMGSVVAALTAGLLAGVAAAGGFVNPLALIPAAGSITIGVFHDELKELAQSDVHKAQLAEAILLGQVGFRLIQQIEAISELHQIPSNGNLVMKAWEQEAAAAASES